MNSLRNFRPDPACFDLEWLEPVVEAGVTLRPFRMTTFRLPDGPVRSPPRMRGCLWILFGAVLGWDRDLNHVATLGAHPDMRPGEWPKHVAGYPNVPREDRCPAVSSARTALPATRAGTSMSANGCAMAVG